MPDGILTNNTHITLWLMTTLLSCHIMVSLMEQEGRPVGSAVGSAVHSTMSSTVGRASLAILLRSNCCGWVILILHTTTQPHKALKSSALHQPGKDEVQGMACCRQSSTGQNPPHKEGLNNRTVALFSMTVMLCSCVLHSPTQAMPVP